MHIPSQMMTSLAASASSCTGIVRSRSARWEGIARPPTTGPEWWTYPPNPFLPRTELSGSWS